MRLSAKAMAHETALQDLGDRYGIVEHYEGRLLIIWGCQLPQAGNVVTVGVCRPDTKGAHFDHPPLTIHASDLPVLVDLTKGAMVTLHEERKAAVTAVAGEDEYGAGAIRDRDGRPALVGPDQAQRRRGVRCPGTGCADAAPGPIAAADAVAGVTAMGQAKGTLTN